MAKVASLFSQVLSLIDRNIFNEAVIKFKTEKNAKGFSSWDQFASLIFAQLAGAKSLREISGGLASVSGKCVHLGIKKIPNKSTLSYANSHRPWQLFEELFYQILPQVQAVAKEKKKRFKFNNPLYSIDSTTIDLCLAVFDWAHFRRAKGAVKMHTLLDHQGYLPCWAVITDGKAGDIVAARALNLQAGSIVVMDRAYIDYSLFSSWKASGVYFVTRAKRNMAYKVSSVNETPHRRGLISDEIILLSGCQAKKDCPHQLRRVTVWDEKKGALVFLTNNFKLAAATIASIYKDRWKIEEFFRAIKQNLKIKTFLGTTENAVKSQLWTALLAMLLIKYLQLRSTFNWSLSNLVALFRMSILVYRDLMEWLNHPFGSYDKDPPRQGLLFDL